MKTEDLERMLRAAVFPETDLPMRARRLKAALLASPRFRVSSSSLSFRSLIHLISTPMSTLKKTSAIGAALVLFVAIIFGFGHAGGPAATPYAQAKEIVKTAQRQVPNIEPKTRSEIEASIKMNMESALAEAQMAPDLHRMSAEEFDVNGLERKVGGDTYHVVSMNPDAPLPTADIRTEGTNSATVNGARVKGAWSDPMATYLEYTDEQGRKVVLGLDKDDILRTRIVDSIPGDPSPWYVSGEAAK